MFFYPWINPQFNFSSQNLGIEGNFFKWDGNVNIKNEFGSVIFFVTHFSYANAP